MRKRFIIYGLAGWCIEVFWTGVNSLIKGDSKLQSQTSIWMFFIYGLAVVLEGVHNKIRKWPIIKRGSVYTSLIFLIEYTSGWVLKRIKSCPWDYSGSLFSIKGLIRLDYAPAWFMASLLFEKLHDRLIMTKKTKKLHI